MRKQIFILFLLLSIFAVGCSQSGNQVKQEYTTPDGQKVVVTGSGVKEGGWCQPGQKWNMAAGVQTADMTFQGVETQGKYAGYCRVAYVMNADGKAINIDMYIKEDGSGYQVIHMGDQDIESEIK